jgi:hypothetical protein
MARFTIRVMVALFTFVVGVTVTASWLAIGLRQAPIVKFQSPSQVVAPVAWHVNTDSIPLAAPYSAIRSVDFENYTYPAWLIFDNRKKTFTLQDGELPAQLDKNGWLVEVGLSVDVDYDDVTGDGIEDAILRFGLDNRGGSAIVEAVYVYAMRRGRPAFLWGFLAGDRAEGGLKSVYGDNGELVVELNGRDKIVGTNLYATDETSQGACCPMVFTRTRYQWRGNRFRQKGEAEVLPLYSAK